ncbi:glycosyltransferase family 4 protein [Sedimentitalea nanhaiensis]|uniref:Glycosyltransferase involved in cell wall bisynthesis n=1 Tax=Sedimentitalea nanhaiensis TaxID=999627 RepID=A0A1I7DLL7_9RHOB|nr:glycosyltransferase family 4 protein [Sedimentitalea nanhaiensis]SFU12526.1 Glycosyltransferase involved in cell wall bisynthesis [Sedimentitalea nanhaiensis]
MIPTQDPLPRLAYLTSLYPAVSHTFIQREIAGLRDLGFEVLTCSMRRPGTNHLTGLEEREAADTSFYIIESGKKPLQALSALGAALASPARLTRTLALTWRTAPPGAKGMLKQLFYLAEAMVLSRHLRQRDIDHVHSHFADPSANVAMLTSALSGIPFSYTLHGPAELYEPEKWHLREKTARAAFVACISHFARSQAMYFSDPAHWDKLRIVHCGVDPARYDRPAPPQRPGLHLVFVGRITPIKGLRVLIDAMTRAHETHPDLTLTLVGDGDDRAHLETLARPLGDAVRFVGFQSQEGVAEAVAAADALVLPSFAEGLPVVLMEALAAGKPVIATQVAGVGELVENGVSGHLVPASDVQALANAITALADTPPGQRAEMGRAGREKVRAEFDAKIEAARIGALFAGQGGDAPRPEPLRPEAG